MPPDSATILVVDDNPATRYSTGRFLRSAGFQILEAATGQEALDLAWQQPAAVVLDVNLPDIDGFEVCRTLRLRESHARTPIIHLSASFVNSDDKVQGLEAGADGYLTHPVEPPVLIATVQAFLRARTAEDALRRSEEKFRAIFDQAQNGIALMDESLRLIELNRALAHLVGGSREDLIDVDLSSLVPDSHAAALAAGSEQVDREGSWRGILPLVRKDGRLVQLEWNISSHSLPGVRLAAVTDITQRLSAEAERERLLASERAARTDAERANRLKDEFLATVSHELRTPLNAIVGWSNVLKMRTNAGVDDYRAGIEAIERNAKVQTQLIADLLDVARITSGKLRLETRPVELIEVVRSAFEAVESVAHAKGVKLTEEHQVQHGDVIADPVRLQQVISNLLTNAIKFTPAGGSVHTSIDFARDTARIRVVDTGKGISQDFLPFLFDTFRQEDAATTRSHEGLGLGLAIVRTLVEMHGGSVTAESLGEGLGATFTVQLRLQEGRRTISSEETSSGSGVSILDPSLFDASNILVVDDDLDARAIVRRVFYDLGANVREASTVDEASRLIREAQPDVIISDIGMPKDDGYELVRRVRSLGLSGEQLPMIALTAFARAEDRHQILERGFQAHLAKPTDIDTLVRTVARLLPGAD